LLEAAAMEVGEFVVIKSHQPQHCDVQVTDRVDHLGGMLAN
jgi:hypothetical protein